jgi:hypothetical protein
MAARDKSGWEYVVRYGEAIILGLSVIRLMPI